MNEVALQIPTLGAERNIEIEVQINGKKRTLHYHVEIVHWEENSYTSLDRISLLKRVIAAYEKEWELIQIGAPSRNSVPITFRKRQQLMPA